MIESALPVVYAYRDKGPMLQVDTRWRPRVVQCTATDDHSDSPGTAYVVKYRQGRVGAAALISEVVSHALLQALGISTLQAALVSVGPALSASYADLDATGYRVEVGLHFGTVLRRDLFPGPPEKWEQLANPNDLARIWSADCWLMNLDRDTYGNVALMDPDGQGRFRLVAVDQSDCFLGSGSLADGTYRNRSVTAGPAPYTRHLERVLADSGTITLPEMAGRIRGAVKEIPAALARVPEAWWTEAQVEPDELRRCLEERALRTREILQQEHWENVSHATAGGKLFQL